MSKDVEPGETIWKGSCPMCETKMEVMHGDDPGETGILFWGKSLRSEVERLKDELRDAMSESDQAAIDKAIRPELLNEDETNAQAIARIVKELRWLRSCEDMWKTDNEALAKSFREVALLRKQIVAKDKELTRLQDFRSLRSREVWYSCENGCKWTMCQPVEGCDAGNWLYWNTTIGAARRGGCDGPR